MLKNKNLKATSFLNIAIGFFLLSVFCDTLIKGKTNFITYFGLIIACLLILSGLYNFFITFKEEKIFQDKRYGFLSLVIGGLFLLSTIFNLMNLKMSIIPLILGITSSMLAFILSYILLK